MHLQCDTSHPQLKRTVSGESRGSSGSKGSNVSSASSNRTLLFGEIPSPASSIADDLKTYRSTSSICNLVMSTSPAFQRFWMTESTRESFLGHCAAEELSSLRLVCHDFGARAAPFLFEDLTITFNSRSFTKPARIRALDKIGKHVKTVTFHMPHSNQTFLPPLIDAMTGGEKAFHYEPQLQNNPKVPRYGTWDMTELLLQQYPSLFHAATNVPSFVRAFSAMPGLQHLKVSCPGQEPFYHYRRDIVDYALISLRIAIERAPLKELNTLSFLPIHAAGLLYMQPGIGFGATPTGTRRWSQINKLAIHMESVSNERSTQTDHLRMLHSYLRFFAPHVRRLLFRWRDTRGPSPFSLDHEPCMQGSAASARETDGNGHHLKSLKFPQLKYMELENAIMDSSQISRFIHRHRRVLAEFNFEDVHLRTGTWDEALAPLSRIAGNDDWRRKQEEFMDVPIVFSPVDEEPRILGPLLEEHVERPRGMTLSRWLSKSKSSASAKRAKEQFWGSSEHMKKFLRASLSPWR
ncbi:hypothetical protein EJ05DRAFT_476027 [Pseudovirgaria hyperparasitica]|uniref:Uncharacterized protein n=1 Tax=Pseudovirgaria hyperparasitica TaxID=470096 RepID=A0A6A6W845_9PEZI|nr:uncharacterized protein EJ05DRAFT_476027 [Pseudovirgaria hyperparasitica]KAF2758715.1 hypothetical protein EJ05DRAFT_476027 [Pseudovirgaria hyperparasitica]